MTWLKRHKVGLLLLAFAASLGLLSALLAWRPAAILGQSTLLLHDDTETASDREVNTPSKIFKKSRTFEGQCREWQHLFFLKVHKAASTTVLNIIYRFAKNRGLHVMLPKTENILSQTTKEWRSAAVSLPKGVNYFDILCNHLVFNENLIRESLPSDAKFVGIVRNPLSQFVSAFGYFSDVFKVSYLTGIPGPDRILTYLQSPEKYEPDFAFSFTHNRMSFDFGMNANGLNGNDTAIKNYLIYLNDTFDLVMISERFDESVILLKRLMGWRLRDILYISNNIYNKHEASANTISRDRNFTEKEKQTHRTFNTADYALYEHFADLFQNRVEAEGTDFAEEVSCFKSVRRKVVRFCQEEGAKAVTVNASPWNDSFQVSRSDCELMTMKENKFVDLMRLARE